jgi:hypothetical protein
VAMAIAIKAMTNAHVDLRECLRIFIFIVIVNSTN